MLDLREKLGEGLLIGDSAVGTLPADRGFIRPMYGANLTHGREVQNLLMQAKSLVNRAHLVPPASMPHLAGALNEAIN